MTGGYTITLHNPSDDSDAEIAEWTEFSNAIQAEAMPDDPPSSVEQNIAVTRSFPPRYRRWSFRARDAQGRLAGVGGTNIDPDHDDNPDLLFVNVSIAADHRRNGLGGQLLARLVEVAQSEKRPRLVGSTNDRLPGGADLARSLGAEVKQQVHTNRLLIADVDRAEMERWVAEGPKRGESYELIGFDGPAPDEWLDKWIDIVLVMNTAPRDDLAMNDFTLTPEQVREREQVMAAAGYEHWALITRHVDSGEWAGFHNVDWDPNQPDTVFVDSTGVRPEHRGHALGKWLKAAMTLRIMDERPNVTDIRTGNADSNDAMLGINHAMGYKPFIAQTVWEVSTDQAAGWLQQRGLLT